MADIEIDNIGEDRKEQAEEEDASLTENTDNTDYDNIQSQISSESATQSETNTGLDETNDPTESERQIQDHDEKMHSKDTTPSKRLNQRRARDLA